jgi:hypothetical protein
MTKIRKYIRCPVCKELLTLEVDTDTKVDRWPLAIEGNHGDHAYIAFFDSRFAVTEVKKKPGKER